MNIKQQKNLGIATLVLTIPLLLPPLPGLSAVGSNTIALTVFFLILLITKPLPLPVICLAALALLPLLSVTSRF